MWLKKKNRATDVRKRFAGGPIVVQVVKKIEKRRGAMIDSASGKGRNGI